MASGDAARSLATTSPVVFGPTPARTGYHVCAARRRERGENPNDQEAARVRADHEAQPRNAASAAAAPRQARLSKPLAAAASPVRTAPGHQRQAQVVGRKRGLGHRRARRKVHFFSSISLASLRIAGVNFFANCASNHGSVSSSRT
jgi:hypothetical protein